MNWFRRRNFVPEDNCVQMQMYLHRGVDNVEVNFVARGNWSDGGFRSAHMR